MIHFYDAATPQNVPSGVHAAVYVNGFAWPQSQIDRMAAVRRITVEGGAEWADRASIIDVETGAATPQDVVPFLRRRMSHGWNDGTAYVNRSNWQAVKDLVNAAGLPCLYWVATLDGTQDIPGAWAVQYQGGVSAAFDLSVLHGVNHFHRP
jgi:hypothetical protein